MSGFGSGVNLEPPKSYRCNGQGRNGKRCNALLLPAVRLEGNSLVVVDCLRCRKRHTLTSPCDRAIDRPPVNGKE